MPTGKRGARIAVIVSSSPERVANDYTVGQRFDLCGYQIDSRFALAGYDLDDGRGIAASAGAGTAYQPPLGGSRL